MFGDVGHGILMAMFGFILCWKEKQLVKQERKLGEIFKLFFGGRYMILLMGLFSIYTGIIYNDMFSKALTIFDSPLRRGLELELATQDSYNNNNHTDVEYK